MTSTPPVSPYGPAAPGPAPAEHRWADAARDAWSVNVRCQAVLAGVAVVAAVAVGLSADAGETAQIMIYVWAVHAVVTLLVGYPVGVVAGRLLPSAPPRGAATGGFALAGAVAGALAMAWAGPYASLGWGVLGAVTAGGARAWAHGAIVRRGLRGKTSPLPSPAVGWAPGPDPSGGV